MTRRWAIASNWMKVYPTHTEIILCLDLISADGEDEARGKAMKEGAKINEGFALKDLILMEVVSD